VTARRFVVFTCDQDGRTAELDLELGASINPPEGWDVDAAGKVTCDRHKPTVKAPDPGYARLKIRVPMALPAGVVGAMTIDPRSYMAELRATGPAPIPFRSARLDLDVAPGKSTWTFVVPVEFVEVEPEA
jgi:hypothetical protein